MNYNSKLENIHDHLAEFHNLEKIARNAEIPLGQKLYQIRHSSLSLFEQIKIEEIAKIAL